MRAAFLLTACSRRLAVLAGAALVTSACSEPAPPPPPPAPAVASAEARMQWYQSCWGYFNNKQFDQFQNCYTESAVSERVDSTPPSVTGRTAIIERARTETAGFPDRKGELQLVLGNGDRLASIALYTATNTGEAPGPDGKPMKPTGRPIGLLIGHVLDLDGTGTHAARDAVYLEEGAVAAQLGLSPAPARPAEKATGATPTVVIAKNDAKEKANLDAARANNEAFNKHDLKAIEASMTDNFRLIEIGQPKDLDRKGAIASLQEMFGALPDVTVTPSTMWAAGDYVVVEGTLAGTNTGDLKSMGLKKTGKKITMRYLEVLRFENGRPAENWLFYNGAAFAAQLGLK